MNPEILLYVNKARLDSNQTSLLFNPPCQLHVQMIQLISPNPNNVDFIDIPRSQNAFLLYRKNYAAKYKSLKSKKDWKTLSKEAGDAWKNELDEVKSYFKILAKLAFEKHKLIYESIIQQPKKHIFISQGPEPQQKQKEDCHKTNSNTSSLSSTNNNSNSSYPQQKNQIDSSYYEVSLLHHLYSNYNTKSPYQQPEQLEDNDNNINYVVSTPTYLYSSIPSFTSDNPSSLSFTSFSPSASFPSCSTSSDFNPLLVNYNNIVNKTDDLSQPAQFITNLNDGKDPLEEFQQYLQIEQADAQLNETYWNSLDLFYECHLDIN
nr:2808_t:CDS:2 [Entrophospora candida]